MSTTVEDSGASGGTAVEHEGICGGESYDTASSGDIHARESRVGGYGALRVEGPSKNMFWNKKTFTQKCVAMISKNLSAEPCYRQ